MTFLFLDFLLI